MKAIDKLKIFIKHAQGRNFGTNEWLIGSDMEVYVRVGGPRILNDGEKQKCLEIANVSVTKRGKGHFTEFLEQAHELNPWNVTFIENVLNPRFCQFFIKKGFTQHRTGIPPCFYKYKGESSVKPN